MSKLNEAFNQYMELEKENNQIERDLVQKEEEFTAITKEMDQTISSIFLSQMIDESEYKKAKRSFIVNLPISLSVVLACNILINAIGTGILFNFPSILVSIAVYLGLIHKQLKENIDIIREYNDNEKRLSGYNSGVINRLRELRELIKSMDNKRSLNETKMRELEGEVVRLLALEMQDEYQRLGIEEEIDIDQATIVANTKNRLELTFKRDGKHE